MSTAESLLPEFRAPPAAEDISRLAEAIRKHLTPDGRRLAGYYADPHATIASITAKLRTGNADQSDDTTRYLLKVVYRSVGLGEDIAQPEKRELLQHAWHSYLAEEEARAQAEEDSEIPEDASSQPPLPLKLPLEVEEFETPAFLRRPEAVHRPEPDASTESAPEPPKRVLACDRTVVLKNPSNIRELMLLSPRESEDADTAGLFHEASVQLPDGIIEIWVRRE